MDIEVFWNYFCVTFKDKISQEKFFFKVSPLEGISQIYNLCRYIETIDYEYVEMVTFNGIHYDCPVLNYIYLNEDLLMEYSTEDQCRLIKQMSNLIIDGELWWKEENLKDYKYRQRWTDIDYFLYWSKMLRKEKKISLKSLGIQLGYPTVQELPVHFDSEVTLEDIPILEYYNSVHDIGILEYLDTKTYKIYGQDTNFQSRIDLRRDAINSLGIRKQCYSWDDVKFGVEILMQSYAKQEKVDVKDLPPSPWKKDSPIEIKTIISDKVFFRNPMFQLHLDYLRNLTVYDTKSINMEWRQGNTIYDLKSGGLHNRVSTGVIKAPKGYKYLDWDVASEYPSLCAVLNVSPPNLPGFGQMVLERLNRRLHLKTIGQGKSQEANTIKLALNGGIGYFNQEHSPYYYPPGFLTITLNGQLYLLMLCEMLVEAGCIIDMANTDGVSFFAPENRDMSDIWQQWESITGLVLEEEILDTVWRTGINEYLCKFTNGYVKKKGSAFITDPDLGNGCDNLIIPKAINNYLLEGIPLRETIINIDNSILDYCAAPKVGRKYTMYYGDQQLPQRLNRFFVSSNGQVLTKYDLKRSALAGYKNTAVTLLNDLEEEAVSFYPVDYDWYIRQSQKIIGAVEPKMTLF
jgi:hypothetical protein